MQDFNHIQEFRADIVNETIQLSKIKNGLLNTSFHSVLPLRVQKFMLSRLELVIENLDELVNQIDKLNSTIENADFEEQKRIFNELGK